MDSSNFPGRWCASIIYTGPIQFTTLRANVGYFDGDCALPSNIIMQKVYNMHIRTCSPFFIVFMFVKDWKLKYLFILFIRIKYNRCDEKITKYIERWGNIIMMRNKRWNCNRCRNNEKKIFCYNKCKILPGMLILIF